MEDIKKDHRQRSLSVDEVLAIVQTNIEKRKVKIKGKNLKSLRRTEKRNAKVGQTLWKRLLKKISNMTKDGEWLAPHTWDWIAPSLYVHTDKLDKKVIIDYY
jgi:hypothetical protein